MQNDSLTVVRLLPWWKAIWRFPIIYLRDLKRHLRWRRLGLEHQMSWRVAWFDARTEVLRRYDT